MHQIWFLDMTGYQVVAGLLFTALGVCASPFFNDLYAWAKGKVLGPRETRRMTEGVAGVSATASAAWGFLSGAAIVAGVVLLLFGMAVGAFVLYRLLSRRKPVEPPQTNGPEQLVRSAPAQLEDPGGKAAIAEQSAEREQVR